MSLVSKILPSRGASLSRGDDWLRAFHWANVALLALALFVFEWRRYRSDDLYTDAFQFAYVLGLDFLFLGGVLTAGSLLLARGRSALRLRYALYIGVMLCCYALLICAQVFFLKTGSQLTSSLVVYAVSQFAMLKNLLAQQTDPRAVKYFVVFAVLFVTLLLASRRKGWPSGNVLRGMRALALATMVASVAIVLLANAPNTYRYKGIFHSAVISRDMPEVDDSTLTPLYQPPRIAKQATPPRSVFVIVLESFRADLVDLKNPQGVPLLPHLRALSSDFTTFNKSYTTISHTSNALVGIFCGMFAPLELTIRVAKSGALRPDCLPELLKPLGYQTGFFQSADGDFEHRGVLVDNMGFEFFSDGQDIERRAGEPLGYLGFEDKAMIPLLEEWLLARKASAPSQPVFVGVLNSVSHHPYSTPGSDCEHAEDEAAWDCYLQSVQYVDEYVGELLTMLKQLGYYDNSLIIVTGDHGEAFGEHGRLYHDEVPYEPVLRVPLWVRGLNAPAGSAIVTHTVNNELRQHIDILPTILQGLDVNYSAHLPGRSLLGSGHDEIYTFCWYRPSCMTRVSSNGDKIILDFDTAFVERYDLNKDPGETAPLMELLVGEEQYDMIMPLLTYRERIDSFWRQYDSRVAGHP